MATARTEMPTFHLVTSDACLPPCGVSERTNPRQLEANIARSMGCLGSIVLILAAPPAFFAVFYLRETLGVMLQALATLQVGVLPMLGFRLGVILMELFGIVLVFYAWLYPRRLFWMSPKTFWAASILYLPVWVFFLWLHLAARFSDLERLTRSPVRWILFLLIPAAFFIHAIVGYIVHRRRSGMMLGNEEHEVPGGSPHAHG